MPFVAETRLFISVDLQEPILPCKKFTFIKLNSGQVKAYDFIFSNHYRYRITRHVLFWLCWFVFIQLTYHYPTAIFPNWDIKAKMDITISKFGVDYITLRGGLVNMIWEITYRQGMILIPYIAFTYAVIYFVLPGFAGKKKKWISTTGILILLLLAFLSLHYWLTWWTTLDTQVVKARRGIAEPMASVNVIIRRLMGPVTFHLITVVGIAIAVKLVKRWWFKQKEIEQAARENASAELQLLKAQIHPHFLFNSLNNIYSFALEASPKAPEMIQKLSGMLHYMLYECKQALVPLEKELKMLEDYVSLEKIRYGTRLKIEVQFPDNCDQLLIAPLLLIPFVENSFKHGTSKMLAHPRINLSIVTQNGILYFKLMNSRPTGIEEISVNGNRGLGLKNVKKRLELLYRDRHELQIMDEPSSYSVWLAIALKESAREKIMIKAKKDKAIYELA